MIGKNLTSEDISALVRSEPTQKVLANTFPNAESVADYFALIEKHLIRVPQVLAGPLVFSKMQLTLPPGYLLMESATRATLWGADIYVLEVGVPPTYLMVVGGLETWETTSLETVLVELAN